MKINKIVVVLFLVATTYNVWSQTCSKFYPFKKGIEFEMTNYNGKNKLESRVHYKILEITHNVNSEVANIENEMFDKKGTSIMKATYKLTCKDNIVSVDFSSLINSEILSKYKDLDIKLTGTDEVLPNNLSIGKTLPDANVVMTINKGPMNMKMEINITDRKVIAKEKLTTKAGTFNCFVVTYKNEFSMGIKQESYAKQWLATGVGLVKQEQYNKKGKMLGYSELTYLKN